MVCTYSCDSCRPRAIGVKVQHLRWFALFLWFSTMLAQESGERSGRLFHSAPRHTYLCNLEEKKDYLKTLNEWLKVFHGTGDLWRRSYLESPGTAKNLLFLKPTTTSASRNPSIMCWQYHIFFRNCPYSHSYYLGFENCNRQECRTIEVVSTIANGACFVCYSRSVSNGVPWDANWGFKNVNSHRGK